MRIIFAKKISFVHRGKHATTYNTVVPAAAYRGIACVFSAPKTALPSTLEAVNSEAMAAFDNEKLYNNMVLVYALKCFFKV